MQRIIEILLDYCENKVSEDTVKQFFIQKSAGYLPYKRVFFCLNWYKKIAKERELAIIDLQKEIERLEKENKSLEKEKDHYKELFSLSMED